MADDYNKVNNYSEAMLQAMEIIANNTIKQVKFDTTIECIIVNDDDKAQGRYIVSNGSASFQAFANSGEYSKDDQVLVTIPNNDYNNQKFIVSKVIKENTDVPFAYKRPFETLLNTTNNLIDGVYDIGIYANHLSIARYEEDVNSNDEIDNNYYNPLLIWTKNFTTQNLTGYTKLGVQAQFSTWLSSYHTAKGNYGIFLEVIFQNKGEIATAVKSFKKYFFLDSDDFFGNKYSYDTYYTQELVFDIEPYKDANITNISLYLYQKNNFYDIDGNRIPAPEGEDTGLWTMDFPKNIFMKDPYVCLGYDLATFNSEEAILTTTNSLTYSVQEGPDYNFKKIELRWLHEETDGTISAVTEQTLDDLLSLGWEIRWYHYEFGKPSADQYSGVSWVRISNTNKLSYSFYPNDQIFSQNNESFKVIIVNERNNRHVISNILSFSNDIEQVNTATENFLWSLQIHCSDTNTVLSENSGNYFIYEKNGELLDEAEKRVERLAYVTFDDSILEQGTQITWSFPYENSMLIPLYNNQQVVQIDKETPYTGDLFESEDVRYLQSNLSNERNIITYNESLDLLEFTFLSEDNGLIKSGINYRIRANWSQQYNNNTIVCDLVKNGHHYHAIKICYFGTSGTSGTDYTLRIDFDENEVALTVGADDNGNAIIKNNLIARVKLFDKNNQEIDISSESYNVLWDWEYCEWVNTTTFTPTYRIQGQNYKRYLLSLEGDNKLFKQIKIASNAENALIPYDFDTVMNSISILRVTLTGFGDYDLVALMPIALRRWTDSAIEGTSYYDRIRGTTYIQYYTTGQILDYNRNPYVLYCYNYSPETGLIDRNTYYINEQCSWQMLKTFYDENQSAFYPEISDSYILKPFDLYIKDAPHFGVQCILNGEVCWTQPILVFQDNYPSKTINQWNGSELVLNEDQGYILSTAIAAGKKESDNTFSGVMMGDWSWDKPSPDIGEGTGLWGFYHGDASFGFTENGTGFIGRSGRGRILLDGNNSQITSASWKDTISSNGWGNGTLIDLDDGFIHMHQTKGYNEDGNIVSGYITLGANESTYPLAIGLNAAYPGSRKFRVDWEGNIYAEGTIYANRGEIGAWIIEDDDDSNTGALKTQKTTSPIYRTYNSTSSTSEPIIELIPIDTHPDFYNPNDTEHILKYLNPIFNNLSGPGIFIRKGGFLQADYLIANEKGYVGGWAITPDSITSPNDLNNEKIFTDTFGTEFKSLKELTLNSKMGTIFTGALNSRLGVIRLKSNFIFPLKNDYYGFIGYGTSNVTASQLVSGSIYKDIDTGDILTSLRGAHGSNFIQEDDVIMMDPTEALESQETNSLILEIGNTSSNFSTLNGIMVSRIALDETHAGITHRTYQSNGLTPSGSYYSNYLNLEDGASTLSFKNEESFLRLSDEKLLLLLNDSRLLNLGFPQDGKVIIGIAPFSNGTVSANSQIGPSGLTEFNSHASITMEHKFSNFQRTYNMSFRALNNIYFFTRYMEIVAAELNVKTPAEKQRGIYARFA